MKHTLSEQIQAVQHARKILETVKSIIEEGKSMPRQNLSIFNLIELDEHLNDAGSTLAALNLTKDLVDKGREEYLTKLFELSDKILVADGLEHEKELENQVAAMSYDELAKAHRRIEELEGALKWAGELHKKSSDWIDRCVNDVNSIDTVQELYTHIKEIESLLKQD